MSEDATAAFLRAAVNFMNFGNVHVTEIRSRGWASATFIGTRHELTLELRGDGADEAAEAFVDNLEEREFDLRGHILADISLVAKERLDGRLRLRLEALTIEDA